VTAGAAWRWGGQGIGLIAGPSGALVPSWPAFSASLAALTPQDLPSLEAQVDRLEPGAAAAAVVCAEDREGIGALAAAAGRLGGVQAWLLVDGEDELGAIGHNAAARLRSVGIAVEVVARPVPRPVAWEAAA
jgi:hypothetical protein